MVRSAKVKTTNPGGSTGTAFNLNEPLERSFVKVIPQPIIKNYQLIISGILLMVLVLFTYNNATENEFVDWDDFGYVVNNDLVRNPGNHYLKDLFTTPIASNYHPLTILSMRLNNNDCKSCPNGISPVPFIRWNIILHALNTLLVLILVYLLARRNLIISLLTAILFGVHPMHVESVAWISERKDVLYTFFFLSGLVAWLNYKKEGRGKYLWLLFSFFLFILSCLSKATAVVFPVVLILIEFWMLQTIDKKAVTTWLKSFFSVRNILLLAPFFIVSIIIGVVAYRIQSGENFLGLFDLGKNQPDVVNEIGPFSIFQKLLIACYGFIAYIIKFVVPVGFSALYQYPPVQDFSHGPFAVLLYLSLPAVIISVILTLYSLKKTKLIFFGLGFYFVTIVLVLQFITVGMALMAERYSYLPYIGLSFIPASLIGNAANRKKTILLVISVLFIVVLIFQTRRQIEVWKNTESLWSNVIEKEPGLELPRRSRGKYYSKKSFEAKTAAEKKMYEEKALADFLVAIRTGTNSSDVYQGTGVIYGSKGDLKSAIIFLNAAIKIDPRKGSAYFNRALMYSQLNQKESAISDYNMALIYKPEWALQILNNRSNLLLETGRFSQAISDFDWLISVEKTNFLYYYNRAYAKQHSGDSGGAVSDYRIVLQLKPDDQMARLQLQQLTSR